ncbi:MAG: ACT domain-containing protein [Bacteroidia bacterium]|nr:ACT domain-containing protein [Bacteroidia bacterium]
MAGEKDLDKMLSSMEPYLNEGSYIFCSFPEAKPALQKHAIGSFIEKEGVTYILPQAIAEQHKIAYEFLASWISLEIHSALDAVGLTAAFSQALGEANISCNVVAGYYHDHIFVGEKDTMKALEVLKKLSEDAA